MERAYPTAELEVDGERRRRQHLEMISFSTVRKLVVASCAGELGQSLDESVSGESRNYNLTT